MFEHVTYVKDDAHSYCLTVKKRKKNVTNEFSTINHILLYLYLNGMPVWSTRVTDISGDGVLLHNFDYFRNTRGQ